MSSKGLSMKFAKMVRGVTAVSLSGLLACFAVAPAAAHAEEPVCPAGEECGGSLTRPLFPDFNIGPVSVFGTFFDTLQEAVDAIGVDPELTGSDATLIDNLDESVTVPAGKNLRISLFAHTLKGTGAEPTITVKAGATVTIDAADPAAALIAPAAGVPALVVEPGATAILESGVVKAAPGDESVAIRNGGTLRVFDKVKIEGEVLGGMEVHAHSLAHVSEVPATCMVDGRPEYWHCDGCGLSFSDPEGHNAIRLDEQVIPHLGHLIGHVSAVEPTVQAAGNTEHWECSRCGAVFADAGLSQEIEKADTVLPKVESPAQGGPVQSETPQSAPQLQASLGGLGVLPQTGDDSMLPVIFVAALGAAAVAAGVVVSHRRK